MASTLERLLEPATSYTIAHTEPRFEFDGTLPGVLRRESVTASDLLSTRTTYGLVTDGTGRDFAQSLRRIQENSGMSWGEVAAALGVSRRTVHNWLVAGRVNGANAKRIAALYRAVTQELAGIDRDAARAHLLAPGVDGTRWALITRTIRSNYPRRSRPGSGFGALRAEAPVDDLTPIHGGWDTSVEVIEDDRS